ncbi:MAG: urea ABC transporter ATP-binding protein UrtD [Snowella sp.]|nr:urea ABC transporter ATP-binding protein UrtD [Snowella sp.]
MAGKILEIENLTVSFDGFKALNNLNFSMDTGELRVIIGPNGAGKTTFLDIITGKVQPTEGRVLFKGKNLRNIPEYKISCLGVGRKFQTPRVYLNLTVSENLDLAVNRQKNVWSTLFSKASSAETRTVAGLLETVGLVAKATLPAALLSHGEKQRLEIGMLVAQSPDLLLVDEPVAGLTDEETENVGALLLALAESHSIIVIEHDMEFVRQIARKVTVLHQGSVLCEGTMDEVQNDPRVIEVYLGQESSLSPHQVKILRIVQAVATEDGALSTEEQQKIVEQLSLIFAEKPEDQEKLAHELADYLLQEVDSDLATLTAEITDPEEQQLVLKTCYQVMGQNYTSYQRLGGLLNLSPEAVEQIQQSAAQ